MAVEATMKYYFLHNIVWYCDPDVMLVRYPLTQDMARAWASLQGLTGQALMASDRMYDLPADRVEILKRVYPAVDIRPLDLFPSSRFKKSGTSKSITSAVNMMWSAASTMIRHKVRAWKSNGPTFGLEDNSRYHIYDFE